MTPSHDPHAAASEAAEHGRLDALTTLEHFAVVTYAVPYERVIKHVHPRFTLEHIVTEQGWERALLSVVTFRERGFRLASVPWPAFAFGQVNYRVYVRDQETGEPAVWFLGTHIDSTAVYVARLAFRLPWEHARIRLDCTQAEDGGAYTDYRVSAKHAEAPVDLHLADTGAAPEALEGFPNVSAGLHFLTHPLVGYCRRADGRLAGYRVEHAPMWPTVGRVRRARFGLLDGLRIIPYADQAKPHSVLLQREIDFRIHLPPTVY